MSDQQKLSRRSFIETAVAGTAAGLVWTTSKAQAAQSPGNSTDELTTLSIREAGELLRRKKVSPVELTRASLMRIEQLNPSLNAFITVTSDAALAQARTAEAEIQRGMWRGPLHGIPIALKDLFDTAGVKTTAGSALFKDRVPQEDAEVVRRLKTAGVVLLGKNNMHEFAYGGTSLVTHFGNVHNPWDLSRIAGGSSGGSAAAVAAQLCFGSLGSDTGGSIRQPAGYCGIVGLKPTYGLVSTRGVIPLSWSLDHVGPLARTVADAAVILQAIAGYDPQELNSQMIPVPGYSAALRLKTSSLRLGIPREFFFAELDPEIEAAINRAISVLEKLTAGVTEVQLTASVQASVRIAVRATEAYAYHAQYVAKTPELYQPETLGRIRTGETITAPAYIQGLHDLAKARRDIEKVFERVDLLITPTHPILQPAISQLTGNIDKDIEIGTLSNRNNSPFDVYGSPAISVPCGFTTGGLPIGLQIVGKHGSEATVLQLAHAYEQATDWHKRRPPVRGATPFLGKA
jgi:aspartyl-tRNA(Asn)/glutamyl-tRNA(Gln) amidotransferase subunit A